MLERAHPLGGEVGVGGRGPLCQVGPHELGERTLKEIGACAAEAHREGIVHLDDPVLAIGYDDEVDERVERVLQQAPLAEHLLEELDVLDAVRELAPEVAGQVQPVAWLVRRRPSRTSVPSARRQPRRGVMRTGSPPRCDSMPRTCGWSRRRPRAAGASGSLAATFWPASRAAGSDEATRLSDRSRRSCSQTEVRSAPTCRLNSWSTSSSATPSPCVEVTPRQNVRASSRNAGSSAGLGRPELDGEGSGEVMGGRARTA